MFMDFEDLKNKSVKELQELLAEKRHELRELKFKVGEKQLKNMHTIKAARRTIARILTLLKSREKTAPSGK